MYRINFGCGISLTNTVICNPAGATPAERWSGSVVPSCGQIIPGELVDPPTMEAPGYSRFTWETTGCPDTTNCCDCFCESINLYYCNNGVCGGPECGSPAHLASQIDTSQLSALINGNAMGEYLNVENNCANGPGGRVIAHAYIDFNEVQCRGGNAITEQHSENARRRGRIMVPLYDVVTAANDNFLPGGELYDPENPNPDTLLRYCQWNVWITVDAAGNPVIDEIVPGGIYVCDPEADNYTNTDFPACCGVAGTHCLPPVVTLIPL